MRCGWNSVMCLCCFGLCFIYDTSQSFIVAWFSVCLSLMIFFTLLFTNCTTKTLKNLFFLIWFIEIVLACSLVVWEQFLALTYLAPLSRMKLNHTFLGLLNIQLLLRGGLKATNFKDYISPNSSQWLLKELEQEVDLVHLYN